MRTLREIGERALIERMRRRLRGAPSVQVGIGDDAAVLRGPGSTRWLFASDMLVEGTHFRRRTLPAFWIGWKALARNLSDIAAMGGVPGWAVVSLGAPSGTSVRFIDEVYRGLGRCAARFGMAVVGGDTVRAPVVIVDVAILGTASPRQLVLRSGARTGDGLFVTGRLGGSYASGRHARFLPRIREAHELVRRARIHAMIDLSDGLASDLWQMSRASRVRMRIAAEAIPLAPGTRLRQALMEGEDFELLAAVSPRQAARLPRRLGSCPLTRIGVATGPGVGVELEHPGGRLTRLVPQDFRHF